MLPPDELISRIRVETDSVRAIAAGMRSDLDQAYRPQVPSVHDAMQTGATIGGHIAGEQWVWLQDVYTECMRTTLKALYNIDQGSQALAQAADVIATRYGDADGFARATADEVNANLILPAEPHAHGRVVAQ
ncbi:hypothetical protein HC031_12870 [Planosporangium thailandense]|uniref:Uncharacterized protein n=1 Tax=Planosporangium thailandense TaxID=765197 RepID=A0ABX0XZ08_9ACTN|nr:hypothetical protein [Planosporangium thailandense]NJC70600.1 hypothetical protein [Planosporangium thailandense]